VSRYDYHQPGTLEEAFRLKNSMPESLYISGGTDLMVRINKKEIRPLALISLQSLPDLSGVENGNNMRIGSMTSVSSLLNNPLLHDQYPILIQAAKELGNVQIRNVATIGGNLCNGSPAADLAPPLLVLEARVRLQSGKKNREIPLEKFYRGPGKTAVSPREILTDILLDHPEKNARMAFYKKGRTKMDLAIASIAVLIRMEGNRCLNARIAAGSVAPTPVRLFEVEALLERQTISEKTLADAQKLAAKSVSPITDIRATESYRRHIVGILVKRALQSLADEESGNEGRK
jgi:carbon-monoxide dehydrogenase medium subunit